MGLDSSGMMAIYDLADANCNPKSTALKFSIILLWSDKRQLFHVTPTFVILQIAGRVYFIRKTSPQILVYTGFTIL